MMKLIHRVFARSAPAGLALVAGAVFAGAALGAGPQVTVYKSEQCGCCVKWVDRMEAAGFVVESRDVPDLNRVKTHFGVPPQLASCHTAVVNGKYLVEGHVPPDLIHRMLSEDDGLRGLAVPGMPMGSPGMEGPNPQQYDVLAVEPGGDVSVYETRQGVEKPLKR